MSEFRIFETEEFLKKLKKLSLRDTTFLRRKLDTFVYPQLKAQPFWGNNIKNSRDTLRKLGGTESVSSGFSYVADQKEQVVYILTINDRKDAYKQPQ